MSRYILRRDMRRCTAHRWRWTVEARTADAVVTLVESCAACGLVR